MIINQIENISKNTEIMGKGAIQVRNLRVKSTIAEIKYLIGISDILRSWDAGWEIFK